MSPDYRTKNQRTSSELLPNPLSKTSKDSTTSTQASTQVSTKYKSADAEPSSDVQQQKQRKPTKAQVEAERRLAASAFFLNDCLGLSPDAMEADLTAGIRKLSQLSDAALRRGKSVTKEDKDDIFKYMEGVRTILKWMDATISRTIMIGVVSAAAAEPKADDIPVMCSMGVQTDPDPVSTPDVTDFKTCVREELAKFKEDVLTSIAASAPKQTYASAAASKPDVRIHTPKTRPALVLESTDPAKKSHKDVLDAWKKDVNFTDVPFAPSRVQTVSNNKVRVEFETREQRDAALDKVDATSTLKGDCAVRRLPMLILKGIAKESGLDGVPLLDAIVQQNPDVDAAAKNPQDLRSNYKRRNKNDKLFNVVLTVSPAIRLQMLASGRINIGHQRVRVQDYSPFVQCFRCLQFGHTKDRCPDEDARCAHCAGSGHNVQDCVLKSDASKLCCFNCKTSNDRTRKSLDVCHSATSARDCPRIKSMVKRLAERTRYD